MKSVDRLIAEHDLIERGLALLSKAIGLLESGAEPPLEFCRWAPDFFAQFADKCHHAKEEDVFFPLLKERGIPEQGGPIGVMLHEHDIGRDCVQRMRNACEGEQLDREMFAAAAKQFVPLLREHIYKENNILFQMAGRVMSEQDDAEVDTRFTQVEQERDLSGLHQRYETEVAGWEQQL